MHYVPPPFPEQYLWRLRTQTVKRARLTYAVLKWSFLNSLAISGDVKTDIVLDFESHRMFTVTVTAFDSGVPKQSSNVTLYITILDMDDNAPEFTKPSWSAVVNENAVRGSVVTQVNATDIDFETTHRKIYYVISGGNDDGVFGIGYENGTVYVANTGKLDRETTNEYELTIEARTLNEFMNETVQHTSTKVEEFVLIWSYSRIRYLENQP